MSGRGKWIGAAAGGMLLLGAAALLDQVLPRLRLEASERGWWDVTHELLVPFGSALISAAVAVASVVVAVFAVRTSHEASRIAEKASKDQVAAAERAAELARKAAEDQIQAAADGELNRIRADERHARDARDFELWKLRRELTSRAIEWVALHFDALGGSGDSVADSNAEGHRIAALFGVFEFSNDPAELMRFTADTRGTFVRPLGGEPSDAKAARRSRSVARINEVQALLRDWAADPMVGADRINTALDGWKK